MQSGQEKGMRLIYLDIPFSCPGVRKKVPGTFSFSIRFAMPKKIGSSRNSVGNPTLSVS